MGLIAHPSQVSSMAACFDGRYILTAGGSDKSVNLWSASLTALEASIAVSPSDAESYVSLLEGGREGQFYDEIVDYFYYCQLRGSSEKRRGNQSMKNTITVEESLNLMKALGYYPSHQQMQQLAHEVKYGQLVTTGRFQDKISFNQLIRLYVNHRPVFHVGKEEIREAFKVLADGQAYMSREMLLSKLQNLGERMSEKELVVCFEALLGDGPLLNNMPKGFTPEVFAVDVLGFENYDDSEHTGSAQPST
eukprot:TRINITY_DN1903_c0_g1_i2.p1 TRINITY_DN1903_c0_g1~~TRINITY_DN1903_c0_g1_i2.p1  ORF type:complete len:249 (-),score=59.15 TRINITY_DN1903_c0_g1_i2:45-791(-)